MINSKYNKLTQLVNGNLKRSGLKTLIFELEDNLKESIYYYPYKNLLSVEDDTQFLYEVYYKILDRVIDDNSYEKLYNLLKENKITRKDIIDNLLNSEEAKIKNTSVINEDM